MRNKDKDKKGNSNAGGNTSLPSFTWGNYSDSIGNVYLSNTLAPLPAGELPPGEVPTLGPNVPPLVPIFLPVWECQDFSCSAIEDYYGTLGFSGAWYNFTTGDPVWPFPEFVNDYQLTPAVWTGNGFNQGVIPVGQDLPVDSCDEVQEGLYLQHGTISGYVRNTIRKVWDDKFRFVIGPYRQSLTGTARDSEIKTAFDFRYQRLIGTTATPFRIVPTMSSLDSTGNNGVHDTLRFGCGFTGFTTRNTPGETPDATNTITAAEWATFTNAGNIPEQDSNVVSISIDVPYNNLFRDPSNLWTPIEVVVVLSEPTLSNFFAAEPPFTPVEWSTWFVDATVIFKTLAGDVDLSVPNLVVDFTQGSQRVAAFPYDDGTFVDNRYFYSDIVVNHGISLGGLGSVADENFPDFVVNWSRNKTTYIIDPSCPDAEPLECYPYDCAAIETESSGTFSSIYADVDPWAWPFPLDNGFNLNASGGFSDSRVFATDVPVGATTPLDACGAQVDQYIALEGSLSTYHPTVNRLNDQRIFMVLGTYGLNLDDATTNARVNSSMSWVTYFEHQYTFNNSNFPGTTFTGYKDSYIQFYSEDSNSDGVFDRLRIELRVFNTIIGTPIFYADYAAIFPDPGNTWVPVEVSMEAGPAIRTGSSENSSVTITIKIGNYSLVDTRDYRITGGTVTVVAWKTENEAEIGLGTRALSNFNGGQQLALGGVGYAPIDMSFDDLKLAFNRNRTSYYTPTGCSTFLPIECRPHDCNAFEKYTYATLGVMGLNLVTDTSSVGTTTADTQVVFGFPLDIGDWTVDFDIDVGLGGTNSSFILSPALTNPIDDCAGNANVKVADLTILEAVGYSRLLVDGTDGVTSGNGFTGAIIFKETSEVSADLNTTGGGVALYTRPGTINLLSGGNPISQSTNFSLGFSVNVPERTMSFSVTGFGTITPNNRAAGDPASLNLGTIIDLDADPFPDWGLMEFKMIHGDPFITAGYEFSTGQFYHDLAITISASICVYVKKGGIYVKETLAGSMTVYVASKNYFSSTLGDRGSFTEPQAVIGSEKAELLRRADIYLAGLYAASDINCDELWLAFERNQIGYVLPNTCT